MAKAQSIWSKADNFLTTTRKIIVNVFTGLILVVLTFAIIGGIGSAFTTEAKIETENKILWFKPVGVVVDNINQSSSSLDLLLSNSANIQQHKLTDLIDVLNHASEDDSLAAVYLNVTELGMYYASAFELADAIRNIKNNGKRVIAYGENFTNNSYLISSQANEVILNEYGGISSFGFSRKRQYVKDLYENIKINYHVFVAGDFKTAPEPYTRTTMSEEDKIAWKDFSDPLWKKMTQLMENGRNLTSGTMQNYGDNFWELSQVEPEISQIALEKGLVDQVMNVEEFRYWLFKEFPNEDEDPYQFPDSISIYDYLSTIDKEQSSSNNKIAIINVEGSITTGESDFGIAGSTTIVNNIQKAIKDKSVKAIVLRVNSPGGGVYASELITNSLNEFKETGRPIVSSMGDIAASGGVWVTTLSDEIWAKNETLTGSIGVWGVLPTFENIYEWAGVNVDGISSTDAGNWDPRYPMPDNVRKAIQSSIDYVYEDFVTKVSENREMPYEEVHAVAKGRIWSGEKAIQLGLVDKIGNLDDAIESAANISNIEDYQVISYKKELDPFEVYISTIIDNIGLNIKLDNNFKRIYDFFGQGYDFIKNDKDVNVVSYCFECEYFLSK